MPYGQSALAPVPQVDAYCWKCGLASGEVDLAGCVSDTLTDHEFVPSESRPFRDWDRDHLLKRHQRATMKARSSEQEWVHLTMCPAAGPAAMVTAIYLQKAVKRYRIAQELIAEVRERLRDGEWEVSGKNYMRPAPVMHPPIIALGERIPEHEAGAYPKFSCCGGEVEISRTTS